MFTKEEKAVYMAEKYRIQREEFKNLLGGICTVCGAAEELEFDHIDWTKKSFNFSRYYGRFSKSKALAELDKCQLLCVEHHKQKSAGDWAEQSALKTFTHGTTYGWMKKSCRCEECLAARNKYNEARRSSRSEGSRLPYGREAEHGTILMYRRKCRCNECRAANTAYARQLKVPTTIK